MTLEIPQTNPRAEYLECRHEIDAAIGRVLERGQYVLGEEVRAFEAEFAEYLGSRHAIGVASGSDALELALRASGIGLGDEVITVSHTAVATVAAIERCGATPVLVDVDPRSYTMAPEAVSGALTARTKAILPVHLYGRMADMAALVTFAKSHGLVVVEDCAQAHGAVDRRSPAQRAGTLGTIAAFSFYPTKNLGCMGDGGCVVTRDGDLADRVRLMREYGWSERYVSCIPGWNSRLDEIQAAILRVKLRRLDGWNDERNRVAAIYDECLVKTAIVPPTRSVESSHVFHQYVVRVKNRERVREVLQTAGIGTGIHYPVPIHLQPAYRALGVGAKLGATAALCGEILSLPMFPSLSNDAVRRVAAALVRASE